VIKFLTAMHPFILFEYKTAFGNKEKGKCFHVIGFDVIIDGNGKPWLLEVIILFFC